ncbi:MAG: LPS export ABC transporter periplasmic protein LptC [Fusobacterium sp.]|nr:LPS export ABC transporter periplasmic protein LptC [Fusobacterium sp.]
MSKKRIYMIIFAVVIVLGYLNYFKEEKDLSDLKKAIETTNVTYESEDYHVEAAKQIDYLDEKETDFEKAKALVKDMVISGDNVFIDKVRNLALKNNILGISPNGWKFNAQTANYEKIKDEITSNTGVSAYNEEKKIKISGKNFSTDSKMSYIELKDDVVLENDKIKLKGDIGKYSDATKIVVLSGNITVSGVDEENKKVDGDFKNLKYFVDDKILEAWEPFSAIYDGVKLSGETLWYQDGVEALKISKNVVIETSGYKIYVDRIEKEANSNIIKFYGKVTGSNGVYSFEGAEGVYKIDSEELELYGDVVVTSTKGEKLTADKIVYNNKTKFITAFGEKKDVLYTSNNGEVKSKEFRYNNETKEAFADKKYDFKSLKYDSIGEKFYFNNATKDGYILNGVVIDKVKKQSAKGKRLDFNTETKIYKIKDDAIFENSDYRVESSDLNYDGNTGKIITSSDYKITQIKNGIEFVGKGADYDENTGELLSNGVINAFGKNFKASGNNLSYNNKTGAGELQSNIFFENTENGTTVTGDKLLFQKDNTVEIVGNLVITSEKIVAKSARGKYNLKDEKVYIPEKIEFESKDKLTSGTMSKGTYDVKKEIFVGNNFKGKDKETNITSSIAKYYIQANKIEFGKNSVITNPETTLKGNKLDYDLDSEIATSKEPYTVLYDEFIIKGSSGIFDNKNGLFKSDKADISSKSGDKFVADKADGNLFEMRIDFIGNAKGHTSYDGKRTDFSGDFARVYFKKDENGYKAIRSEVKKNAVFIQEDKTLYSDYIEADIERSLIFARDNTKMLVKDMENGDITITSDVAEINMNNDTATLIGKVYIENINKDQGKTVITADKGIARQKTGILDLIGNVKIENAESRVESDEAIYNMNTKKLKARGHVYINHKNQ